MATSHVVTATVLYTVDKDGQRTAHLHGDTVSGLSAEDVARFKACGAIAAPSDDLAKEAKGHPAEVDYAATSAGPVTAPERHETEPRASEVIAERNSGVEPAAKVDKPAKAATRGAWVQYGIATGQIAHEDDVDGQTRDDLRERFQ